MEMDTKSMQWELLLPAICGMSVIVQISLLGLKIVRRWDPEEKLRLTGQKMGILILTALAAGMAGVLWKIRDASAITGICLWLVSGCLFFACITDLQICRAYNFTWWPAGMAGLVLWGVRQHGSWPGSVLSLLGWVLFALAQQFLFARLYGRADCHALCVCTLAQSALGMGMVEYLMQIILAFLLLSLHQGIRQNIGSRGRLKVPVPFLPYITIAYHIVLMHSFFGTDGTFLQNTVDFSIKR